LNTHPRREPRLILDSERGCLSWLGGISSGPIPRIACLAVLFALELLVISTWLDTGTLRRSVGLTGTIGNLGSPTLRAVVAAATFFVTFAYLKTRRSLQLDVLESAVGPISPGFLVAHLGTMFLFGLVSSFLFATTSSGLQVDLIAGVWLLAGVLAIAFGGLAFLPPRFWSRLLRATGWIWAYALVTGCLAYPLTTYSPLLWKPSAGLTLSIVRWILRPFISNLIVDPVKHTIGSQAFHVSISSPCAGLEGVGLMLVFSILWIWFFRSTCRFPQVLLLVPAGIVAVWLLNAMRIAVLILIGNAGAPHIALGGFHSQAGWMAFNGVALGFAVAARRLPWLVTKDRTLRADEHSSGDPNTAYLMPFLVILAAGMISRAVSAEFEWLYPLRFFAAAAVLWCYRSQYRRMDWSFSWVSTCIGALVFFMWLVLEPSGGNHANHHGIGAVLASASPYARMSWIAFRALAAVVTVPIAEELAFRSFLIRRIISPHFESVASRSVTLVPVLISAIAFGLLHGDRWLAGTIAGLLYAFAFLRRGRIGDAVAAHAATNALLAGYVLLLGKWSFW
jgi:exosortase E/protease (VPEID-CTERM system)